MFIGCILAGEKHLRQRISELLKYRRNGITKLEGLYVFMLCYTINCFFCLLQKVLNLMF